MNAKKFLLLIEFALLAAMPSLGALITSASQIGMPQTVIDFGQFAGVNSIYTQGPVSVGSGVTFSSTNPYAYGSYLGSGPFDFANNGSWNTSVTAASLGTDFSGFLDQYTMTFAFAQPVKAVGGTIDFVVDPVNAPGFHNVTIQAIGSNGAVLETDDISALEAAHNLDFTQGGLFFGISSNQADISAFSLSNSDVAIQGLVFSGSTTATPEPGTTILLFIGAAVLLCRWYGLHRRAMTK